MTKSNTQTSQAFSLIEMLIVISIIAVLCAFSLPKLTMILQQSEMQVLITQMQSLIHEAAEETLIRHSTIALQLQTLNNHQQLLLFANPKQDGVIPSERDVIRQIKLPHYGTLHARFYPHYRNFLLFFPQLDGRNDNGSFWFCRNKEERPTFVMIVNNSAESRVLYPTHARQPFIC